MNRSILEVWRLIEHVETARDITERLNYERGNGFGASFARLLSGHSSTEADRAGIAAKQLIDQQFKGDAVAFKAFMGRMTNGYAHGGAAFLEFGDFVSSGAAPKAIQLERSNPKAFNALLTGTYADINAFNQSIDKVAALAGKEAPLAKGRISQTIFPAVVAGTPNDLPCAVTPRSGMSCEWDKAQAQGTPIEREAAQALRAGAELLETAAKNLQAPPGPRK